MQSVLDFIYEPERPCRDVLVYLHELLTGTYGLQPVLRYRIPFYDQHSWVCYLNPVGKKGVEIAFIKGNELSNSQGMLDFRGRKQVAGIIIEEIRDVRQGILDEIILESLWIDEQQNKLKRGNRDESFDQWAS